MISNDGFSNDRDIFEQKYPDSKEGDIIHLFLKCILSINCYFSVAVIKHDEHNQLRGKNKLVWLMDPEDGVFHHGRNMAAGAES